MSQSSSTPQGHASYNFSLRLWLLARQHSLGHPAEGSAGASVLLSLGQCHRDTSLIGLFSFYWRGERWVCCVLCAVCTGWLVHSWLGSNSCPTRCGWILLATLVCESLDDCLFITEWDLMAVYGSIVQFYVSFAFLTSYNVDKAGYT